MTATQAMPFNTGDTPLPEIVILAHNLQRDYELGAEVVRALRGVDFQIKRNEFVAIMGPSGSGKSTLMNLVGCLDTPTGGEYWLNGQKVSDLSDNELAHIRNKEIGFVFQTFNLLPRADALHNVELPLIYADEPTGNLDSATGEEIMQLFEELWRNGQTIVLVTHEHDIAAHARRQIHLRDGKIERDERTEVKP